MATANPLEEILNSDVDESKLNAVLGSLQSQLASPTLKAQVNPNYTASLGVNNTGNPNIVGPQTHANLNEVPHRGSVSTFVHSSPQPNIPNINGSKNMIGGVPVSHMNSVVNAVTSSGYIKTENNFNTQLNSVVNSAPLGQMQSIGVVKNELGPQRINVTPSPTSIHGSKPHDTIPSSTGSAILSLANVASEQKPILLPSNPDGKSQLALGQDTKQQVVVNVVNPNSVQRPQYLLKQDTKPPMRNELKQDFTQHALQTGQIKLMTHPTQQVSNSFNVINSQQNMLRTPFTASSTSVVVTKPVTNPQTVTVVRPAVSTTFSSVPNMVNSNSPRISNAINRAVVPRAAAGGAPIRIAPQHPQFIRSQGGTISFPPGTLPPGAVLMKNAEGQLVLVPGAQANSQKVQQVRPGLAASKPTSGIVAPQRPTAQPAPLAQAASRPSHVPALPQGMPITAQPQVHTQPAPNAGVQQQQSQMKESVFDSMKKCKNFLQTLIKLASQSSNQPSNTVDNVKKLIQLLIDAKIEPEVFTEKLQAQLNSSPQPYLVPFLRKSLPMLRMYLIQNKTRIEGVRAPPVEVMQKHPIPGLVMPTAPVPAPTQPVATAAKTPSQPAVTQSQNKPHIPANIRAMTHVQLQQFVQQQKLIQQKAQQATQTKALLNKPPGTTTGNSTMGTAGSKPSLGSLASASHTPSSKDTLKRKFDSSAIKDDDDINDVATMGGVNLTEESRNILASNADLLSGQMRSCKDESFLASQPLVNRINDIARRHGLDDCPAEVASMISHATQERIKNLLERLSVIAEHRLEIYKNDGRFERTTEPRSQLKFLEELDQLEKKRHSEAEREVLLRAAKSRSKNEDPEREKLREKAKQMQQQELEAVRQREANMTALAAIGPRKKRKIEDTSNTPDGSGSSSSLANVGLRPRVKRVNLRDLMFLIEQEREVNKSTLMFKAFLK